MPNQHSIFVMDPNKNGILDSLKELLNILSCSKCNKSFCDSQQFLKCGHLSCISCLNNNNSCFLCSIPHGCPANITQDQETLERIVQLCEQVVVQADNIRLKKERDQSIFPSQPEVKPPVEPTNGAETSTKPIQTRKKRKRRGRTKSNPGEEVKRPKVVPFKIPKNIEKTNHKGETILLVECRKNHIDNVKLLLKAKPKPNLNTRCAAGWTPLQECADFGFKELLTLLLEEGADPNFPGYEGRTALHEAAKNNYTEIIELLLQSGANKDIVDSEGKRPIDHCSSAEASELIECGKTMVRLPCSEPRVIDSVSMKQSPEKVLSYSSHVLKGTTGKLKLRDVRRKKSINSSTNVDDEKTSNVDQDPQASQVLEQPGVSKHIDKQETANSFDVPRREAQEDPPPGPSTSRCDWSAFASERTRETSRVKYPSSNDSSFSHEHIETSNKSHGSKNSSPQKSENNSEQSHHLDLYYVGSDIDSSQNRRESESILISSDSDELIDVEN